MKLPELPEPAAHLADSLPLYTEAQMLALRAATVEACAAVCTGIALKPSNVILGVAIKCADAIRGME